MRDVVTGEKLKFPRDIVPADIVWAPVSNPGTFPIVQMLDAGTLSGLFIFQKHLTGVNTHRVNARKARR